MLSGAFRRAWSQAHTDVFALAMNMRIMMYLQLCVRGGRCFSHSFSFPIGWRHSCM